MFYEKQLLRLGFLRVLFGGYAMFLSIPFLIFFHVICILLFFNTVVRYSLGVKFAPIRKFLIIDRYKIDQLSLMDKINCVYCGYANGMALYFRHCIEKIFAYSDKAPPWGMAIICFFYPFYLTVKIAYIIHGVILYQFLIFKVLGYHYTLPGKALEIIKKSSSHEQPKNKFISLLFKDDLIFAISWLENLEQIESAWCPVKHLDSKGIYPEHHHAFSPSEMLDEAASKISRYGTVSQKRILSPELPCPRNSQENE